MTTVDQVFYYNHCLGAVLPHVLFSSVMSSLFYSFSPALIFALRCLRYETFFFFFETFYTRAQQSEIETDPEREGAGRNEGQWRCPAR